MVFVVVEASSFYPSGVVAIGPFVKDVVTITFRVPLKSLWLSSKANRKFMSFLQLLMLCFKTGPFVIVLFKTEPSVIVFLKNRSLYWKNTGPSKTVVSLKGSANVCRRLSNRFSKTQKLCTSSMTLRIELSSSLFSWKKILLLATNKLDMEVTIFVKSH